MDYTPDPTNNPTAFEIPDDGVLLDAAAFAPTFEGLADAIKYTQAKTLTNTVIDVVALNTLASPSFDYFATTSTTPVEVTGVAIDFTAKVGDKIHLQWLTNVLMSVGLGQLDVVVTDDSGSAVLASHFFTTEGLATTFGAAAGGSLVYTVATVGNQTFHLQVSSDNAAHSARVGKPTTISGVQIRPTP